MTRALLVTLALASGAAPAGFDELRESLSQTDEADARVRHFIEQAGGTPVVEGSTAIFIVEGDPQAPPRVLGDFNNWGEGEAGARAAVLERLGSSRYFFRRVSLPTDARVEYLTAGAAGETPDPHNPRRVQDFAEPHSELRMPGYRPLANASDAPAVPRGRVVSFDHVSETLGNTRRVHVYLPPGYDAEPGRVYPEAWLGDGTTYVESLRAPRILDHLIAEGRLEPLVGVFVDPVERRVEYGVHAGFRRMILSELVPRITAAYRVANLPARRLVAGGSRGGQAALDLCLEAPHVFGQCGAWAPAIDPRRVPELIDARPARARFFLVRALYDERFGPDAPALRDALTALGAEVVYGEAPQGHNLASWPDLMARVLIDVFPAPAAGTSLPVVR
jgi:enterochelin esterase-like enzyme